MTTHIYIDCLLLIHSLQDAEWVCHEQLSRAIRTCYVYYKIIFSSTSVTSLSSNFLNKLWRRYLA